MPLEAFAEVQESVSAPVSVEEYLRTSYRPDRELVDGELREKPMPTDLHGTVQSMIGAWFAMHMKEWGIAPASEVRTRVRAERFRLPDVSLMRFPRQFTKTQNDPPLIAIEILSEDDRYSDLANRAGDLRAMGVEHIWLIDPDRRLASIWDGRTWQPAAALAVSGTAVHLDLMWLWAQIDLIEGQA